MINKSTKRELLYFIPIFIFIIGITIGFNAISPKLIPGSFGLDGLVSSWTDKSFIHYHIPATELIIYIIFSYFQIYQSKGKEEIEKYFFHIKYFLIIVIGITNVLMNYLVATRVMENIWYIIGPVIAFASVYVFITMLTTGFLNAISPQKQSKSSSAFKKKHKKFNKK